MGKGSSIIDGLKDAIKHARCTARHIESHITTLHDDGKSWVTECSKCGRIWKTQVRKDEYTLVSVLKGGRKI